jgi:hypothetical protein
VVDGATKAGERRREEEEKREEKRGVREKLRASGDLVVVEEEGEEMNKPKPPYRITALCSVFSPSRLTSWMGPSGRRARVLETCIEVNMAAR